MLFAQYEFNGQTGFDRYTSNVTRNRKDGKSLRFSISFMEGLPPLGTWLYQRIPISIATVDFPERICVFAITLYRMFLSLTFNIIHFSRISEFEDDLTYLESRFSYISYPEILEHRLHSHNGAEKLGMLNL